MMDPIQLDADLVNRFRDKTMAVVGYETNQANLHILPLFYMKLSRVLSGYENERGRQIRSHHLGLQPSLCILPG